MSQKSSGAGATSRRIFPIAEARKILAQRVGEPSDVVIELGGLSIALHPLTTADSDFVIEVINGLDVAYRNAKDGATDGSISQETLLGLITSAAGQVAELRDFVREQLSRALYVKTDEERELFDAWWNGLPFVETLKTVLPNLIAASGLSSLVNPLTAAGNK